MFNNSFFFLETKLTAILASGRPTVHLTVSLVLYPILLALFLREALSPFTPDNGKSDIDKFSKIYKLGKIERQTAPP